MLKQNVPGENSNQFKKRKLLINAPSGEEMSRRRWRKPGGGGGTTEGHSPGVTVSRGRLHHGKAYIFRGDVSMWNTDIIHLIAKFRAC
ncbi:hypothetical protein SUGI_0823110 [Cryptomeria japonica]|nr:hypothetical protein SUGI_0823110 [Cryptomeria japonica]